MWRWLRFVGVFDSGADLVAKRTNSLFEFFDLGAVFLNYRVEFGYVIFNEG